MKGTEFTDKIKKKLENILQRKFYWRKAKEKSIKVRIPVCDHGNKTDIDIGIQLRGLPFSVTNSRKTSFFFAIEVKYRKRKGWIEVQKEKQGVTVEKVKELQRKKSTSGISFHPHIRDNFTRQLKCYADQCPDLVGLVTNMPIDPRSPYEFSIGGYHHGTVPSIAARSWNLTALVKKMEQMFNFEYCVLETQPHDLSIGMEVSR